MKIAYDAGIAGDQKIKGLTLSLDRTQLSTEIWQKLGITLTNTGLIPVENIAFAFSGEFETKGIKPISVMAEQSSRMDISILPKNVGNILLEITLTYKDIKSREYSKVQEFWIDVVEKGTTIIPQFETLSSPVGQFTPKPLTQKQLPTDLAERYTESEFIGKGGFARVFKAKRKDGKFVAVKIPISLDAVTGKSFIAEMQNWTKLSHPNIVGLYDFNIMPMPYFEEELCDSSLSDQSKPIESEEAAWILFNVCEGLKFAHARQIIHRDLKPQNILLKSGVPKISDWGLSRIISESTITSATSFTPYYAAPEQINNRVKDERTDIWQLGVILYELVTGVLPFKGDSMIEIGMNIATKDPIPPGEIKPDAKEIDSVVIKCLEKYPAKRYQSVLELQKDLAIFLRKNYAELLNTSVTNQDYNRSAFFCGDLVMINMLTGDLQTSYKYLLDLVHYSKGDVKADAQELSEQIKMRMDMGVTEIPDELIQKAEIIVHYVSLGFRKSG
jgi:serine/threonine protein kinase